ncbi:MAG TPA: hypothetical protein PL195_02725 [bacterium]|nr:hypothetical protein [bacterium]
MRKVVVFIMIFVMSGMFITLSADAAEPTFSADKERAFGFKIMGGGRYDDLRMCVGSPAGVKGGPVGDIKLFMKFRMSLDWSMTVTIPVFRPILFGAGFKMLQYESDVAMEYKIKMSPKTDFVTGPGIGLSYHYGPDYNSESSGDKRTDSFFALGPMISYYAAFDFKAPKHYATRLGINLFHVSLFRVDEFQYGKVFGGALEFGMYF